MSSEVIEVIPNTEEYKNVDKKRNHKMLGSPKHKKNYKISPSRNNELRRYRKSRSREHKKNLIIS